MSRAPALVLLLAACQPAPLPRLPAEAPESFLPEGAALVVHVDRLDALQQALAPRQADLASVAPLVTVALAPLSWTGALAAAVYLQQTRPTVVLCGRGTDAEVARALQGLAASDLTVGGLPVRRRGGLLGVAVSGAWLCAQGSDTESWLAAAIAVARSGGQERSLGQSAGFAAARAAAAPAPGLLTAVVDLALQVDGALEQRTHNALGDTVLRQLELLQLRTLRALGVSLSAAGPRLRLDATLALSKDRIGIAGLTDVQPGPFALQGILPESVGAHELVLLRANLRPLMEAVEAAGSGGLFGDGPGPLQLAQSLLGVNFRDDVVKQLSGEFALFAPAAPPADARRSVREFLAAQVLVVGMQPGHGLDDKISQILRTRQIGTRRVLKGGEVWSVPLDGQRLAVALCDEFLAAGFGDHDALLATLVERSALPVEQRRAWDWSAALAELTRSAGQRTPAQCSGLWWSASGARGFCVPTAAGMQLVVEF